MERILPFITLEVEDEKSGKQAKFVVNEDAAAVIGAIEEPVAVVSIAGLYRTGKSFILNQLAEKIQGFNIGSTVEPCTQGIWLWSVNDSIAAQTTLPKGSKMIFLDTEGLGSYTKSETYDVQIFSLSVLLSSYFIYNSMGTIDENALDKLSLVVQLSKHIRAQSLEDNEDHRKLPDFFPSFMWLLRDFALELKMQGREITSKEYLETALKPMVGDPSRVGGKNEIREAIRSYFADRYAFCLKRPVNDEALLANLEKASERDFREDYLEEVVRLRKEIFRTVRLKKLYGAKITGRMLIELAREYVRAINEGTVPVIRTAWQSVSILECHAALESAKKLYSSRFEELVKQHEILEEVDIDEGHMEFEGASLKLFRSRAVGEDIQEFEDDLRESNLEVLTALKQSNRAKSETECGLVFLSLTKHVEQYIREEKISSIDELGQEYASRCEQFMRVARGPAKMSVLSTNLQVKPFEHARQVSDKHLKSVVDEWEKRLTGEREKSKGEYVRLEGLYKHVDDEWKRSQTKHQELLLAKERLMEQVHLSEDEIRAAKHAAEDRQRELDEITKRYEELTTEIEGIRGAALRRVEEGDGGDADPKGDDAKDPHGRGKKQKSGCAIQ